MAEEFPHPFECKYSPKFGSQHRAAVFIEFYQAKHYIKRCGHLRLQEFGGPWSASEYGPICKKDSFESTQRRYGGQDFHGCPKDCRFYEPAWKVKWREWRQGKWWAFRGLVSDIWSGFTSAAPHVQTIIALTLLALALAWLGYSWQETILQIVKMLSS